MEREGSFDVWSHVVDASRGWHSLRIHCVFGWEQSSRVSGRNLGYFRMLSEGDRS